MKAELSKQNQTRKNPTGTFFGKNLKNNFFSKDTEENHSFFSSSSPKNLKNNYHFFNKNSHDKNIEHNASDSDSENYEKESLTGNIPEIHTPHGSDLNKETEIINEEAFDKKEPDKVVTNENHNSNITNDNKTTSEEPDTINSKITVGPLDQPEVLTVSPFGRTSHILSYELINYDYIDSKHTLTGDITVYCPWGTNSGGRTDVPSATAPVVTKDNYIDIKNDLTPSERSPHDSPRTKYYSKALVERHEKFHGKDFHLWVINSALKIIKNTLESGKIYKGEKAETEIVELFNKAKSKVSEEFIKWHDGDGTSYYSYPAEKRAYADGKDHYQQLADDVEKHGKKQKELEEIIIEKTRIFD